MIREVTKRRLHCILKSCLETNLLYLLIPKQLDALPLHLCPRKTAIAYSSSSLLTVNSCIKVRLDLQADKSPVVVKGPFFPQVVNPRY
jgi:hypothetical protein